jgi:epsilon-lactone hydrolase
MSSIIHLVAMWFAAVVAVITATFRRMLLGPTLRSWTWRTEWTVASVRAIISVAARHRDDPVVIRFGMRVHTLVPLGLRRRIDVRRVRVGDVEADRYLPADVFQPARTMLYFHGGGYVFGNPGTHRQFVSRLVDASHAGAVAPRYRLAPHHRYPAAVDDALAAYQALLGANIEPWTITVAGDSAGGGLAIALLIRLRSLDLPMPGGAMLFSPYLDLGHNGYSIRANARTDYLPLHEMSKPNDWYCDLAQIIEPEVSPVHADLTGMPPMLVFAGGAEMLLSDAQRLVENAARAGVPVEFVVEPEMMHVWPAMVEWEPAAHRALATASAWINR